MRRLLAFLLAAAIFVAGITLRTVLTDNKLTDNPLICYNLSDAKFNDEKLISENLDDSTLLVLGSSEMSTTFIPTHPLNMFYVNGSDFNTMLVGRGNYQCLSHLINVGALDKNISGNKLALILSPQWFVKGGISAEAFVGKYNNSMLYNCLHNPDISDETKQKIISRLAELGVNEPTLVDKTTDEIKIKEATEKEFVTPPKDYKITSKCADTDWDAVLESAQLAGENACTNNNFGVYDDYFNKYIAESYAACEGSQKDASYLDSTEYDDFQLFLDVCSQVGVEPLIIIVPLNGLWCDYTGFPLENRTGYYERIKAICDKRNVQYADFSKNEYEKYFLCDIMHLGWKGWARIDEAFYEFYSQN